MPQHKLRTINVSEASHKDLKAICKTHNKSIVEFIQHAVIYFKKTGIDPERSMNESPHQAIKELSKRVEQIIGVIKVHEQQKINPLLEALMMLSRRTEMMLNDAPKESLFRKVLTRTEEMMDEDQKHHVEQLNAQHKYYENQFTESKKQLEDVAKKLDKMTALIESIR